MDNPNQPKNLLFKWIGGKKWLSKRLKEEMETISLDGKKTYIEPFIGGMGAFFALFETLKKGGIEEFILNDINETIIMTYNLVKDEPEKISAVIAELEAGYADSIKDKSVHSLNKTKDKDLVKTKLAEAELYFKSIRTEFNILKKKGKRTKKEKHRTAALFLFLQDHSFNGVYRENGGGDYNTPFNWDPKNYIVENKQRTILEYSKFFRDNNVTFKNMDVFELLEEQKGRGSELFIYLDPPYLNEGEKSENRYNKDHFGLKEQQRLLDDLESFETFMFSNHYLPIFKEYFGKIGHRHKAIPRKNIMTAKKENRGNDILEILGVKETNQ